MSTIEQTMRRAGEALDVRAGQADRLLSYFRGEQGAAYMTPKAREALQGRLGRLGVNLTRLAVETLAERLDVAGFEVGGDEAASAEAWRLWRAARMPTGSAAGHVDSLLYGTGYVSVWADAAGAPTIRVESPRQCWVDVDPVTGEPVTAVKRWWDRATRRGRAVVFTAEGVWLLATGSEIPDGAALPAQGWTTTEARPNALGAVPITVLPNRPTTDQPQGESEVGDLLPLVDALNKIVQDLMVVSEGHSRPRRFATGLEVVTEARRDEHGQVVRDEDGEPIEDVVPPVSESPERFWQFESPDTRVGEFPASGLGHFGEGAALILRQIAAVTSIPPQVLGLSTDAPASAEALRASEVGLVARAKQRQAVLGQGWARVARLALTVGASVERPAFREVEVVWRDPETRSEIVSADRASKLHALGVPLPAILADLGWSPRKVAEVVAMQQDAQFAALAEDVRRLVT